MASYSIGLREFGTLGKVPKVSVYADNLSAATFTAQMGFAAAFRAAVLAVTLGEQRAAEYSHLEDAGGAAIPSSPNAQRENKWLVSCRETGGGLNVVTFTIPCADLSLLGGDGESMDTGAAEYTALVAAVEDFVRSNDLGAVAVETVKFRARTI